MFVCLFVVVVVVVVFCIGCSLFSTYYVFIYSVGRVLDE